MELGFSFGFNGIATYSESYDKVIRELPLDKILIETDCPYLTPRPKEKSERNEPLYVKYVAEKVAAVKNISVEEVEKATFKNAEKLFEIKSKV